MFLRLSRGLRRHNERAMCLLHHALDEGEFSSLITISFLIPHIRVPGGIHIPDTGAAIVGVQPPLVVP